MSVSQTDHDSEAKERRRSERLLIFFDLQVIDLERGTPLGDVIDISSNGMRIIGATPLETGEERRVRSNAGERVSTHQLDIVVGEGPPQSVCFDTHCVWSRYVEELGHYEAGCTNTLAPSAAACITQLIEHFQSADSPSV